MSDYWRKYYIDSALLNADSALKQVGKTVSGAEVSNEQIDLIVEHITAALELTLGDSLCDLCCGNGLLTVRLAERVGSAVGIDFTPGLLDVARERHARGNLQYRLDDVLALEPQQLATANKLMMYEALQHLTLEQFGALLGALACLPVGARFFVGGIPDQARLRDFYDTDEKFHFYEMREQAGKPHLGRWWGLAELSDLARNAGFTLTRLAQPKELYSAYYRFDVLLERA